MAWRLNAQSPGAAGQNGGPPFADPECREAGERKVRYSAAIECTALPILKSMTGTMPSSLHVRPRRPAPRPTGVKAIGGFLFDVDGVIADTANHHLAAWRRIAEEEGLPFDEATARDLRGLPRDASLRRILGSRTLDAERFAALMERKNACYVKALDALSPFDVLPGVLSLLDDLARLGLRAAAVSASRNARIVLARVGVTDRFETIIDGEDAARATSGLHRFLLAASTIHVAPARCVVIEDSQAGVAAARSFRMRVIGLGDPRTLCAATLVFESLRGVRGRPLVQWLSVCSAA